MTPDETREVLMEVIRQRSQEADALRARLAERRDEVASLKAELAEARATAEHFRASQYALEDRVDALRAEIERLTPKRLDWPPTQPGWYWLVDPEHEHPRMVRIVVINGRWYIEVNGYKSALSPRPDGSTRYLYGPIPEPPKEET